LGCGFAKITLLRRKIVIEEPPYISVIVPVYNGEKFLDKCLDALFSSKYASFEVVVVDDGSTDKSAEISSEKGATVLTTSRPQSGPAAARNFATREIQGKILLFIDADVVVKSDTIAKVAAVFQQHPNVAALFGSYDDDPEEKNFLSQYRNLLHHFVHQNSNRDASTFWTGLGAIRREIFNKIGGFDCEQFAVPSIEDIELGTRLRANGYHILLDKEIQAKHLKKWKIISMVKTDIFCRAIPWAKMILTNQAMINDLNLKTTDRMSAILTGLSILTFPLVFFHIAFLVLLFTFLIAILILNRKIFSFFAKKRGISFAILAFPWQFLYFFYSGAAFTFCWFRYYLPQIIGINKR
jgi:glycosyltransferase involved in cell wall biosynthesis